MNLTDSIFDHLCGIVAVILFIWSVALLWASWQVNRMLRILLEERKELRRWKRLQGIYNSQRAKWQ